MNIRKLIIIPISLLLSAGLAYAQSTTSQIVKKYSPSVVTIVALDQNDQPLSLGSGFFINTEGDIASNHHLLEGSAKAIIKTMDGRRGEVLEIINDDPQLDLLIAKTSLKNTNPLPLGDSDTVIVGEEIIAIGNPAGLEGTVSNGIVSGVRKAEGFKSIQITAPISPGSSGGPVFNSTGKVIGITTAYLYIGQNLNFAMPINYLKSLKPSSMNLSSLPKIMPKAGTVEKDRTLVEVFDVHYENETLSIEDLTSIVFAIKNLSNYPIKNIKLIFVYKNSEREVISYSAMEIEETILPQLALQFSQSHHVKYFNKWELDGSVFRKGEVEIRILDYQIDRMGRSSPADWLFK
jgi:hypothetical protein